MNELAPNHARIHEPIRRRQTAVLEQRAVDALALALAVADADDVEGELVERLGRRRRDLVRVEHVSALRRDLDPDAGAVGREVGDCV